MLLSDRPWTGDDVDHLGFNAYADALAELIDNPETDTPLTIAISAEWGAGKTSLAKMVERRLKHRPAERGDPSHIVAWFNAWMHDDAPHLGAAFAADVAKAANKERPRLRRLTTPLPTAMLTANERWRRRLWIAVGALAAAGLLAMLLPGLRNVFTEGGMGPKLEEALGARLASVALVLVLVFVLWEKLFAAAKAASSFVDDPRSEAARGSMDEVSRQLGSLIAQATRRDTVTRWLAGWFPWATPFQRRRFVVFVDDLERCRPPRALEVCEVASQLLAHPDVVAVLIADMSVIAASAEIKYAQLEGKLTPNGGIQEAGYGRAYLEKIVQLEFVIPPTRDKSLQEMLRADEGLDDTPRSSEASHEDGSQRESRIRSLLTSDVLWWTVGILCSVITGVVLYRAVDLPQDTHTISVLVAPFIVAVYQALRFVMKEQENATARQTREELDVEILKNAEPDVTPTELESLVMQSEAAKKAGPEFARQRIQRHQVDESAVRREAESEILAFLPPLPRGAKRMYNRLRVLIVVAIGRHMLDDTSLSPAHLGRWIVLNERWPDLASTVSVDPTKLRDLETVMTRSLLEEELQKLSIETKPSGDLLRFLTGFPRLNQVVNRLVHLDAERLTIK